MLNTASYDAEVDFWTGAMGARPVGGWDRGGGDRGALLGATTSATVTW